MVLTASDRLEDKDGYVPPTLRYLGTLQELTRGGTSGADDGMGGAGDVGSLG